MLATEEIELPLYNAFTSLLRLEQGQPNKSIDTRSYLDLINLLRAGYLLNSKEELIFFCKKLWLKPFHLNSAVINEKVLEAVLEKSLQEYMPSPSVTTPASTSTAPTEVPAPPPTSTRPLQQDNPAATPAPVKPPETNPVQKSTTVPLVLSIEESDGGTPLTAQENSRLFNDKPFQFDYQYLPVSRRFIEQTIRSLRYKVKRAGHPVIDIAATVQRAVQKGYVDQLLLRGQDDFITRWTLFLDRGGSMMAFHSLQDAMVDAAFAGSMHNEGDVFYLKNTAHETLYTNPDRTRSVRLDTIADGPMRNILIVSDAGAARGSYNDKRIDDTYLMLYYLRKHRVAWLNPLPKARWENTSAAAISEFVNMFEPGDDDYADNLGNIVQLFKSKIITKAGL